MPVLAPPLPQTAIVQSGQTVEPDKRPQDASAAPPPPDREIVVTAERVRGSAIGNVAPVAVLNADAIRSLGATSVKDLLERVKALTTSASGGEPVVLLNGRRISGFDELQSIPPEAIERMEVLPEQDAARFGVPPSVRVMNFILLKRYRGTLVQELAGGATDGGGATNYTEVNVARIDGDRRATFSASRFDIWPVFQRQRDIAPESDPLFSLAGVVTGKDGGSVDPALDALAGRPVVRAAVPVDAAQRATLAAYVPGAANEDDPNGPYRTIQRRERIVRVTGTLARPIGGAINASLNLSLESTRSNSLNGLAPLTVSVPGANGALPFSGDVLLNRYLPDTPLEQRGDLLNLHAGTTLQGGFGRWNWNVTAGYDRIRNSVVSDTGVDSRDLQSAVTGGADPFVTPTAPALLSQRSRTVTGTLVTKAVVNGPLVRAPAGDVQVGVTVDLARSTSSGTQPASPASDLRIGRTVEGLTVNSDVPILTPERGAFGFLGKLNVNGTLSLTNVSPYGQLIGGSYGATWTPLRPIQLTASIKEARTPPAIFLLANPTTATGNVPYLDTVTGETVLVTSISGGRDGLRPERRRTTTLGIALQPFPRREVRFGVDYVATQIADPATALGGSTFDLQSTFPDLFNRDEAGRLIQVDLRPINIAREQEHKLRFSFNVSGPLGPKPPEPPAPPVGAKPSDTPPRPPKNRPFVRANMSATLRLSDEVTLRNGKPPLDLLDGATLTGYGDRARWEAEGDMGGSYGPVSIGMYGRLQGPTRVRSNLAESDLHFSGRTWLVLYSFVDIGKMTSRPWAKSLAVNFTVENLLNDRINVTDRNGAIPYRFQPGFLDPLGRSIRLGLRKTF